MISRPARLLLLPLLLFVLLISGCTDNGAKGSDPQGVLRDTKAEFDKARTVSVEITSQNVPSGVDGVSGVKGAGAIDANEPKFKGSVTATVNKISGTLEVLAIKDSVWMKLFTPDYRPTNVNDFGAPNPAQLFNPTTGVSTLLTSTTNPAKGTEEREGKDVVTTYSGKVPGKVIDDVLKLGDGKSEFDVTYSVTDKNVLRKTVIRGQFFTGSTSTYTIVFSNYGSPVDIVAP